MVLYYTDKKILQVAHSISFFFQFMGCITYEALCHWREITWRKTLFDIVSAGAHLALPLFIASMLLGASMTLSLHYLLAGFKLHNRAMELVQGMLIRDFTALPVGFVLCVHC